MYEFLNSLVLLYELAKDFSQTIIHEIRNSLQNPIKLNEIKVEEHDDLTDNIYRDNVSIDEYFLNFLTFAHKKVYLFFWVVFDPYKNLYNS